MLDSTPNKQIIPQPVNLPFPYHKQNFCRYEPIEQRIDHARVLIVNNLLRYETDLSELAKKDWGDDAEKQLRLERKLTQMACDNIASNVKRLVKQPKSMTVHLSEVGEAAENFRPDAIVMSGTLTDFDYYNPKYLESFQKFIKKTKIPVLGICGAHQLIGVSFGCELKTLDNRRQDEIRTGRMVEFQYRCVKIIDTSDPIFAGIADADSGIWQDYTLKDNILRVWQNHG
ncbi:MAG: glutamine amidotransferase-related protein, partial [Aridibacter sp.]